MTKRRIDLALLAPLLLSAAGCTAVSAATPSSTVAASCEALQRMTAPDFTVISATLIPAGPFSAGPDQEPAMVPNFCRVKGSAAPTSDSHIEFEVWIPADTWNGKFQAVGVGGYMGAISYGAMITALNRGYAVEGNDTGHKGGDPVFGLGHPEKVVDWSWRAMHVSAQAGKLIVRNGTGRWPSYSYFVGCSSGGHQALSEAQRFPGDFDGIIAGAPGYNRVNQTAAYLWSWLALHDENGAPLLTQDKLRLVSRAAVALCGDENGVIQEPRACRFDPASLLCEGEEKDACLTQPQVDAIRKIHRGAHNPRTGERIYSGWAVGSEAFGNTPQQGWGGFLLNPSTPMRSEVFAYFLFENPDWDWRTFDFDHDLDYAKTRIGHLAATDPDLSAFKARGGKLLMYTGWLDPIAPAEDAAAYYEAVAETMGGFDETQSFFRFFMVPGMGHCGGGPGATEFDMLDALERWVEDGLAPDTVEASHFEDSRIVFTRPLCPYPLVSKYTGEGDRSLAANHVCREPSPSAEQQRR